MGGTNLEAFFNRISQPGNKNKLRRKTGRSLGTIFLGRAANISSFQIPG